MVIGIAAEPIEKTKVHLDRLSIFYGPVPAVRDITMHIPANRITSLIGPSGCGKSTLLRALNRMNDIIPSCRVTGEIRIDDRLIYGNGTNAAALRKSVGMVFQKPNPFPKSIFENVAYGPRVHGVRNRHELEPIVERSLRRAALWDEVRDRLHESALKLSGGQQQRLCIARALAVDPMILLLDEPTSALDPRSTARIEDLLIELKTDYTIIIVTHNMQQAARISDYTGFLLEGELIEFGPTNEVFTNPKKPATEDYITGRFG